MKRRVRLLAVDEDFHRLFKSRASSNGMSVLRFSEQIAKKESMKRLTMPKQPMWNFRL